MLFADTNVLLYAISNNPDEAAKAARANELLFTQRLALSAQVLQEFYVQATRVSRADRIDPNDAAALVASFRRFTVAEITAELVIAAITTHQRFDISYWDAAIIEAARAMGCTTVLSEDLSDTVDYDGVRVKNPFVGP